MPIENVLISRELVRALLSRMWTAPPSVYGMTRRHCAASVSYDVGMEASLKLYRPVGKAEMELIRESGFSRFPPRLAHQPIFYPVLNEEYAREIAEKWNTRDEQSGYRGYVTRFALRTGFAAQFPVKQVGGASHLELWIPAERVEEMNCNLIGKIGVIAEFWPPESAPRK